MLERHPPSEIEAGLQAVTDEDVLRVLASPGPDLKTALALFSGPAMNHLEKMAGLAHRITLARFGRTISLYAPLYLSNHCINQCTYCGFNARRKVTRIQLSPEEAVSQAQCLFVQDIRHLLLVTGEAPNQYGLDCIGAVARRVRRRAASIAVEIFPCDLAGYTQLAQAGVDGLVLYQETYDPQRYREFHPAGPKKDFYGRLAAMDAGGQAHFRSLGIGALLGLTPHRVEAVSMVLHGAYLMRKYPHARLAISFPRLRPVPSGTPVLHPVSDAELVQLVIGFRLLFPDAELVVSTRESAQLRDRLLPLGVTRISAGSRTTPGGYGCDLPDSAAGQFEPNDQRSVGEVIQAVQAAGYDTVTKDFDAAFIGDAP